MSDIEIGVIGELALHVFAPERPPPVGHEALIQLGGGAGMITRHLSARGVDSFLLALTGGCQTGRWLRTLADDTATWAAHAVDQTATSSIVYVFPDDRDRMWVMPGQPNPSLLMPLLTRIGPESLIHCPVFPGFEPIYRDVAQRTRFLVLDFGHFEAQGKLPRLLELVQSAPPAFLAQLNGAGLDERNRRELLAAARRHGFSRALVTAGPEPLLGYDGDHEFTITPEATLVLSSMGAGDVLIAEVMYGLANRQEFREACMQGCRAATIKCRKWGI